MADRTIDDFWNNLPINREPRTITVILPIRGVVAPSDEPETVEAAVRAKYGPNVVGAECEAVENGGLEFTIIGKVMTSNFGWQLSCPDWVKASIQKGLYGEPMEAFVPWPKSYKPSLTNTL